MWARVENGVVVELYPHSKPLREGMVNYPRDIFRNPDALKRLGIWPVRRVQSNAPDDTHGWKSVDMYTARTDYVEQKVTWTKRADFDVKVAERDANNKRSLWNQERNKLEEFLYFKGYISETELKPADLTEFQTWER